MSAFAAPQCSDHQESQDRRGCPTLAHLADALGLLPGPPLLRAAGLPGDAVARDRALQQRADTDWATARPDDDEDDPYPRPQTLDVADLAPHWTALTVAERAALLVAVEGGRAPESRRGVSGTPRARLAEGHADGSLRDPSATQGGGRIASSRQGWRADGAGREMRAGGNTADRHEIASLRPMRREATGHRFDAPAS